jgi:hypothetical protein
MVESGSTAGQVLQKCGRLYNAKPTGLVNIHSCWGKWTRCIHSGEEKAIKRDIGKGRPMSVGQWVGYCVTRCMPY